MGARAGDAPYAGGAPYEGMRPVEEILPAPMIGQPRSGWYLRGDIGYAKHPDPDVTFGPVFITDEAWEDTWTVGVGLGYRFSDHIRVDVTGDYRLSSDITFADSIGAVQTGGMDSTVLLANVYWDITNMSGFTPYIGAGIGATYNRVDRLYEGNPPPDYEIGENNWAFAAALMAGVSYDVSDSLKLDANYRYLWLGDGQTAFESNTGVNPFRFKYDDLAAHEFRIGARYEFGNPAF